MNFHKPLFLSSVFILFFLPSYSQTKEEIIKSIRKNFRQINSDRTLKKISLEDEEFLENMTDGGRELSGYFRKDSIVKVFEWVGLSYGNRTREYYFKDGFLSFVFEKFESFIETKDGLDHYNVKTTFEGRYYFNNKKLVTQRITGKRTFDEDSKNIVKKLFEESNSNVKLLIKKRSKL